MWVFQNNSFVSVVAFKGRPGILLVRSRIEGDIQRAVPGAEVFEDLEADYRYRSIVTKADFAKAMIAGISRIDYHNFKNSIGHDDHDRHSAYMGVWSTMVRFFGAYVGRKKNMPSLFNERPDWHLDEPDEDMNEFLNGQPDLDRFIFPDRRV